MIATISSLLSLGTIVSCAFLVGLKIGNDCSSLSHGTIAGCAFIQDPIF